ncbi:MAG: tetratricopeptide repeat protein [Prochlorococcus marinus XMU1428]|nr:tetratricopeptide repeat protein [Prochlorococcus marinus XMU1428]
MNKSDQDIINYTNQLSKNLLRSYDRFCAFRNRGILYFYKKSYQMAIVDFTSAIELSKHKRYYFNKTGVELKKMKARVYFLRGIAYIKMQNLDEGINNLEDSLELYSKIIEENKFELNILSPEIRALLSSFFEI